MQGEFTDPRVMREALDGASGLFLLSPVALEALTGTPHTLTLTHAAGVRDVVYLSVIHADRRPAPLRRKSCDGATDQRVGYGSSQSRV